MQVGASCRRYPKLTCAVVPAARRWHPRTAWRSVAARHEYLRYAQIIPVGLLLWGSDAVDRFRAGAAPDGRRNAVTVDAVSRQLGGGLARTMNEWLFTHALAATAAAWFYIVMQVAVVGFVAVLLIRRRVPTFGLHRNALIACNLIGLVVFWLYPVAPPRMLPEYHDITGWAVPLFSRLFESKAADQFASLPSLHVAWALWVAVAASALLRHPAARAALWIYPAATVADVFATANHYVLDAVVAPGVLLLAYAIAASPALAHRLWPRDRSVPGGGLADASQHRPVPPSRAHQPAGGR